MFWLVVGIVVLLILGFFFTISIGLLGKLVETLNGRPFSLRMLLIFICAFIATCSGVAVFNLKFNMLEYCISVCILFVVLSNAIRAYQRRAFIRDATEILTSITQRFNTTFYLNSQHAKYSMLDKEEIKSIFISIASTLMQNGTLTEMELNDIVWFFNKNWYDSRLTLVIAQLNADTRHSRDTVKGLVQSQLALREADSNDFTDRYMPEHGAFHHFRDGHYYVPYSHSSAVRVCACCGQAETVHSESIEDGKTQVAGEWFCSRICKETEEICLKIKDKPWDEFLKDATVNGFVLVAAPAAWSQNHKIFASGGQGHGFAAEHANNRIDRLLGKDAAILGDDNAKNGPDRMVDGQLIQDKYCKNAARSVGAAFDGQDGPYKYMDPSGKPMQVEVPRDQYEQAVKVMAGKIRDGKVPGVTDPEQAPALVRRGHLTYAQAQNITKFCTIESITYDVYEGAIVSSIAGGINFGVTTFVSFIQTRDMKTALRVAAVSAGKTFGKTLTVYVVAQQLHRLGSVQTVLNYVDIARCSKSVQGYFQSGLGVKNVAGANKILRGTIVTSIVVIAVTTGPDLVKLVRGHISSAQFLKNLAVATSGVAGGVVGSFVGGIAAAPLGPVGMIVGRIAGGVAGGIIASVVTDKVAGKMLEDDRVKITTIIQEQLEYLATTFILTDKELLALNQNLEKVISQKTIEAIYAAASDRRAMATFFLKPVVVGVVKQRPQIAYNVDDVLSTYDELAADELVAA